jgi:hypothetical protein
MNPHDPVANGVTMSGSELEPFGRRVDPPSRFGGINHIPVDHKRLQLGGLDELETATADQAQSFACGGGKFTFKVSPCQEVALL